MLFRLLKHTWLWVLLLLILFFVSAYIRESLLGDGLCEDLRMFIMEPTNECGMMRTFLDSQIQNMLETSVESVNNRVRPESMTAIIADAKMDIPEAMIETQKRQMIEEFAQRIQSQGLSFDQYMQFTGMTPDSLLEQVAPQAESRIKSRLVLEAVAAAEKLDPTEEEIEAEIKKMAEEYKMEVEKINELLGENGKKQMAEDLAVSKAAEFVVENAKEK